MTFENQCPQSRHSGASPGKKQGQAEARRAISGKEAVGLSLLFATASLLFLTLNWMGATFGAVTVDQIQFVYHSSLAGMDRAVLVSYLRWLFLPVLLMLLYIRVVRRLSGVAGTTRQCEWLRRGVFWGTMLYFVSALVSTGNTLSLASLLSRQESSFIREHYVLPSGQEVFFPAKKRNLIIVLAESAEHTFNNPDIFDEAIMPELQQLAGDNLSFTGHVQVPGTEWTIAGITSFLFGIPLRLPLFNWNDYSLFDTFLPGTESLLEIFAREGYAIAFFLGSDSAFSGKKNLFAVHAPTASIYDLNHFQATRVDVADNLGTGWGVADPYVFARAKEFLDGYADDAPFVLIVETVDTHNPDPYVRPDFKAKWGDYRDAFAALSYSVSDFVGWFEKHRLFENTTVVVLGDHLHMSNELGAVDLREKKRAIYNVFVNSQAQGDGAVKERTFASFDLCPTILESIGATVSEGRFGLGVSLFRDTPTLLEQLGEEAVIHELSQFSPFYMDFYKGR